MSQSTYHAAMYGEQFGKMIVGRHKGPHGYTPMCLFSHWLAGEDRKGNPLVITTSHWAGGDEPTEHYEIIGDWDAAAEERFQSVRHDLMRSVGLNPNEQISLF